MNLKLSSKQIQTFAVLLCMIVMNISLSARADNSPLLMKITFVAKYLVSMVRRVYILLGLKQGEEVND